MMAGLLQKRDTNTDEVEFTKEVENIDTMKEIIMTLMEESNIFD